jgi:putative acetyltransferase
MAQESRVRPYTHSDHQALMTFLGEVLSEMGHEFLPDKKDSDIRDIEDIYINNLGAFHVIEIDERICGSVGVRRFCEDIAELKRLYVAREHRGAGFGHALCETALSDAMRLGYRRIRLDTTTRSQAALSLFRKLGFQEIPKYNADPYAEIFMEKALNDA